MIKIQEMTDEELTELANNHDAILKEIALRQERKKSIKVNDKTLTALTEKYKEAKEDIDSLEKKKYRITINLPITITVTPRLESTRLLEQRFNRFFNFNENFYPDDIYYYQISSKIGNVKGLTKVQKKFFEESLTEYLSSSFDQVTCLFSELKRIEAKVISNMKKVIEEAKKHNVTNVYQLII